MDLVLDVVPIADAVAVGADDRVHTRTDDLAADEGSEPRNPALVAAGEPNPLHDPTPAIFISSRVAEAIVCNALICALIERTASS